MTLTTPDAAPAPHRFDSLTLSLIFGLPLMLLINLHIGHFFTQFWILGYGVLALLGCTYAIYLGAAVVRAFHRRSRVPAMLVTATVLATIGLNIPLVTDRSVWAKTYYLVHQAQFDMLPAYVESIGGIESFDYYGPDLPAFFTLISADGKAHSLSPMDDNRREVLFVDTWMGIPDDAVGFGYFPDGATGTFDAFGSGVRPQFEAGGGWWWMSP